jgi:hypothetical protein
MSALRHTQVSGIPLAEQQLTSTGIPIVIHKCLQFIESIGLDIEGLYRISGEKAKIRKLILAFNQGECVATLMDTSWGAVGKASFVRERLCRHLESPRNNSLSSGQNLPDCK